MPQEVTRWAAAVIAFVAFSECAVLVYLALVTWLMTAWFLDDATAMRMTDADWYAVAGRRMAGACLLAAVSGAIVYVVNRVVAHGTGHRASRLPLLSAIGFAAVIVVAAAWAAVRFLMIRPWF